LAVESLEVEVGQLKAEIKKLQQMKLPAEK
jgi:hypothetical protein